VSRLEAAWDLTRRLSPRPFVRAMTREADGGLHVNQYPQTYQLSPLVPSTPWCMHLAGPDGLYRFIVFDLDAKTDEARERAADDVDVVTAALTEAGIPFVVCRSSASGGFHVWVALRESVPVDEMRELTAAAGAVLTTLDHGMLHNAVTGACRPPGAPHRDGSVSTIIQGEITALTEPVATRGDVATLTAALRARIPAIRPERTVPSGPVDEAHRTHRPLARWGEGHMATIAGGDNPSRTGYMCLLAAAQAGWSFADVEHAAHTAPGMEHYRTKNTGRGTRRPRNPQEAHARLQRQWQKAQAAAALFTDLPAERAVLDTTDLEAIVSVADEILTSFRTNPGRWNATETAAHDRAVLTALLYLSLHTGKRAVAAAIRTLGIRASMGRTTAADALTRLVRAGYITRATAADGPSAATWRLRDPLSTPSRPVRSQPGKNPRPPAVLFDRRAELIRLLEQDLLDLHHDLFTRKGLGYQAGRVYATLRTNGATPLASLASTLGLTVRRTATVLSRLRTHKIVVPDKHAWRLNARDLRARAAATLEVTGTLAARAALYALERTIWTWWLAEQDQMHTEPSRRTRRPHVTARTLTFTTDSPGERQWPRYPRDADGRGDHKQARYWVDNGMVDPGSLWWSSTAA